jgi:competence protein ComEC
MEWWIVALILGHLSALFSPILLPTNLVLAVLFITLALTLTLVRNRKGHFVIKTINGFVMGAGFVMLTANLHYANYFVTKDKQQLMIKGKVSSVVVKQDNHASQSFSVIIDEIDGMPVERAWYQANIQVRLNWFKPKLLLQQGDELLATIRVSKAHGYQNTFGFDYNQWLFSKQFQASGNIKTVHSYLSYSNVQSTSLFSNTQQTSTNKLISATNDLATQSLILAIGLGNRSLIKTQEFERYNHMGISHLLAISGLHIGIIFLVVKLLIKGLLKALRLSLQYMVVQVLILSVLWSYIALISFPISATRAALLVTFWILLNISYTNVNKIKALLFVALFSLLLDPFAILTAAWWLTFSAVLGIVLFIQKYPSKKNLSYQEALRTDGALTSKIHFLLTQLMNKLVYLVKFQVFITLWMVPVVMFWFGGVSLSGVLTNLIAIPLFSLFIVPAIFIGTVVVMIDNVGVGIDISSYIFFGVDALLNQLITVFSHYPIFHYWVNIANGLWFWFLLLIGLLLVSPVYLVTFTQNLRSLKSKFILTGSIILPCILVLVPIGLSFPTWNSSPKDSSWLARALQPKLTMYLLDVGQGTSVLFQQGHSAFIYDLGPIYPSGFNATQSVVQPMLVGVGITDIRHIVISHNDSDHIGDIKALGKQANIKDKILTCTAQSYKWGRTQIDIIWPNYIAYQDINDLSKNDTSCVIKLTDELTHLSVLLTGDITVKIERRLVKMHNQQQINLKSDLLISAHHGSKYSSTSDFINAVSATKVLHSAGVNNRFGFPTKEVIQRFNASGMTASEVNEINQVNSKQTKISANNKVNQYSTNQVGMIKVEFDKPWFEINHSQYKVIETQLNVSGYLNHWQPFWKKQNPFSFTSEIR